MCMEYACIKSRRYTMINISYSVELFYSRFEEKGGILFLLCLSVFLSITNFFRHTFLSNHASQPLQTWYGTSARAPTCRLPNFRFAIYLLPVFWLGSF